LQDYFSSSKHSVQLIISHPQATLPHGQTTSPTLDSRFHYNFVYYFITHQKRNLLRNPHDRSTPAALSNSRIQKPRISRRLSKPNNGTKPKATPTQITLHNRHRPRNRCRRRINLNLDNLIIIPGAHIRHPFTSGMHPNRKIINIMPARQRLHSTRRHTVCINRSSNQWRSDVVCPVQIPRRRRDPVDPRHVGQGRRRA